MTSALMCLPVLSIMERHSTRYCMTSSLKSYHVWDWMNVIYISWPTYKFRSKTGVKFWLGLVHLFYESNRYGQFFANNCAKILRRQGTYRRESKSSLYVYHREYWISKCVIFTRVNVKNWYFDGNISYMFFCNFMLRNFSMSLNILGYHVQEC